MSPDVFFFPIRNENLRCSTRTRDEAFTRTIRRRGRRGNYTVVFHFVGSMTDVRACDTWDVSPMRRRDADAENEYHVLCRPSTEKWTVDRFDVENREVVFSRKTTAGNNTNRTPGSQRHNATARTGQPAFA
jgi:hypothetical protein